MNNSLQFVLSLFSFIVSRNRWYEDGQLGTVKCEMYPEWCDLYQRYSSPNSLLLTSGLHLYMMCEGLLVSVTKLAIHEGLSQTDDQWAEATPD